jgi:hypothetical protein
MSNSLDSLLAEWKSVMIASATDAMTVREIVTATGRPGGWVREQIRQAIAEGKMRCVRKMVVQLNGVAMPLPAYQLVAAPPKKKKA